MWTCVLRLHRFSWPVWVGPWSWWRVGGVAWIKSVHTSLQPWNCTIGVGVQGCKASDFLQRCISNAFPVIENKLGIDNYWEGKNHLWRMILCVDMFQIRNKTCASNAGTTSRTFHSFFGFLTPKKNFYNIHGGGGRDRLPVCNWSTMFELSVHVYVCGPCGWGRDTGNGNEEGDDLVSSTNA